MENLRVSSVVPLHVVVPCERGHCIATVRGLKIGFDGRSGRREFMAHFLARWSCVIIGAALSAATWAAAAWAHPHVAVTASATINFEKGAIASIDHVWTFDEFYSAMAVEGLPKNKDGGYGREELAELAKVNIDGLKEFGYFTFVTLEKTELKVGDPKPGDYWLEHKNGVLSLHFKLPVATPVLPEAKGFSVTITDPSYFIAFEMDAKEPAKLNSEAPKSCKLEVGVPKEEAADAKKLSGAFQDQLGGANLGFGIAKSIMVECGS